MTWYVTRDGQGSITAAYQYEQAGLALDPLPDNRPELVAFLAKVTNSVPQVISDRQFYQLLALKGLITQDEALAAVQTGALPSLFLGLISQLPGDQRFAGEMLMTGATEFRRDHPLVNQVGEAMGWPPAMIDQFWIEAYAL